MLPITIHIFTKFQQNLSRLMGVKVQNIDSFANFELIGFANQWSISTYHSPIYFKFLPFIPLIMLYLLRIFWVFNFSDLCLIKCPKYFGQRVRKIFGHFSNFFFVHQKSIIGHIFGENLKEIGSGEVLIDHWLKNQPVQKLSKLSIFWTFQPHNRLGFG